MDTATPSVGAFCTVAATGAVTLEVQAAAGQRERPFTLQVQDAAATTLRITDLADHYPVRGVDVWDMNGVPIAHCVLGATYSVQAIGTASPSGCTPDGNRGLHKTGAWTLAIQPGRYLVRGFGAIRTAAGLQTIALDETQAPVFARGSTPVSIDPQPTKESGWTVLDVVPKPPAPAAFELDLGTFLQRGQMAERWRCQFDAAARWESCAPAQGPGGRVAGMAFPYVAIQGMYGYGVSARAGTLSAGTFTNTTGWVPMDSGSALSPGAKTLTPDLSPPSVQVPLASAPFPLMGIGLYDRAGKPLGTCMQGAALAACSPSLAGIAKPTGPLAIQVPPGRYGLQVLGGFAQAGADPLWVSVRGPSVQDLAAGARDLGAAPNLQAGKTCHPKGAAQACPTQGWALVRVQPSEGGWTSGFRVQLNATGLPPVACTFTKATLAPTSCTGLATSGPGIYRTSSTTFAIPSPVRLDTTVTEMKLETNPPTAILPGRSNATQLQAGASASFTPSFQAPRPPTPCRGRCTGFAELQAVGFDEPAGPHGGAALMSALLVAAVGASAAALLAWRRRGGA